MQTDRNAAIPSPHNADVASNHKEETRQNDDAACHTTSVAGSGRKGNRNQQLSASEIRSKNVRDRDRDRRRDRDRDRDRDRHGESGGPTPPTSWKWGGGVRNYCCLLRRQYTIRTTLECMFPKGHYAASLRRTYVSMRFTRPFSDLVYFIRDAVKTINKHGLDKVRDKSSYVCVI